MARYRRKDVVTTLPYVEGDPLVEIYDHSGYQKHGGVKFFGGKKQSKPKAPKATTEEKAASAKQGELAETANYVYQNVELPLTAELEGGDKGFTMSERAELSGGIKNADLAQHEKSAMAGLRTALQQNGPLNTTQNYLQMGEANDAGSADRAANTLNAAAAGQNSLRESILGIAGPGMGVSMNQATGTARSMLDSVNSQVSRLQNVTNDYTQSVGNRAAGMSSMIMGAGQMGAAKINKNNQQKLLAGGTQAPTSMSAGSTSALNNNLRSRTSSMNFGDY